MLVARPLGGHAAALLRLLAPSVSLQAAVGAQGAAWMQQCASYSQPAGGGSGSGAAGAPPPSGPLVGFKVTIISAGWVQPAMGGMRSDSWQRLRERGCRRRRAHRTRVASALGPSALALPGRCCMWDRL